MEGEIPRCSARPPALCSCVIQLCPRAAPDRQLPHPRGILAYCKQGRWPARSLSVVITTGPAAWTAKKCHRNRMLLSHPGKVAKAERDASRTLGSAGRRCAAVITSQRGLPGSWTSRRTDAAAAHAARRWVAERHGQAGAALLQPGERFLTTQRIIDYGKAARSPARPALPRKPCSPPGTLAGVGGCVRLSPR